MKLSKLLLLLLFLFKSAWAYSQTVTNTPPPLQSDIEEDQSNPNKTEKKNEIGYARIWLLTEPNHPSVAGFAMQKLQDTEVELDHWICRQMPPGFLASFVPLPAGKYFLQILEDTNTTISIQPDGNARAKITSDKILLKRPVEFSVAPKSYQTICLIPDGEMLQALFFYESGLSDSERLLRVFNFAGDSSAKIKRIANGVATEVGDIPAGKAIDFPVSLQSNATDYEISITEKSGKQRKYSVEIDHRECQVGTIAVFRDRYGRMTAQPAMGAPVSTVTQ